MSTTRTYALIVLLLVLAAGAVFFFSSHIRQSQSVAIDRPPAVAPAIAPVPSTPPEENLFPASEPKTSPPLATSPTISGAPTYEYNPQGQLAAIHYADGSAYTYRYNSHGDKIGETTRTGRIWTYVYDDQHHPLAILDPEGRATHPGPPANTQPQPSPTPR